VLRFHYSLSLLQSAAQRAFRERKQTQLAELQARVQTYEQGEIERNVQLQNIAKRLKEENEALRLENKLLKERMINFEQEHEVCPENDKKRWRDDSPLSNPSRATPPTNKRSRVFSNSPSARALQLVTSPTPSPSSMVSSPASNGSSGTRFSPPFDTQLDLGEASLPDLLDLSSNVKPLQLTYGQPFDCGFCNEDTPCVCREIAVQQAAERMGVTCFKAADYSTGNLTQTTSVHLQPHSVAPTNHTSILDNLPPYFPPVPLRAGPPSSKMDQTFVAAPPLAAQCASSVTCSGEPSNCAACADDAFGKAFCTAIEESITAQSSCADCPCKDSPGSNQDNHMNCCIKFPNCSCGPSVSIECEPETIPTNDAWRQLKSHPNVAFADLTLLAEVVARRSKCTGPEVVISPALGSVTPERTFSPKLSLPSDNDPILLADPHAHYHQKERIPAQLNGSSPPGLGQHDVPTRCSRRRVRKVQTDAVQAALRLLDAKFS
jgi:AP-1-like factor